MSTAQRRAQRSSWRQKPKTKNPWVARIVFTVVAVVLIGVFLYLILPSGLDRKLRVVLVHAVSFDSDVIMPPMFAETAWAHIEAELEGIGSPLVGKIQGEKNNVLDRVKSSLQQPLQDEDDAIVVIVRGYLLAGPGGEPSIACSDLSPGPSGGTSKGLLPLVDVLQPLASDGPDSFSGTRLVVLDIEPLAAQPRLGQYADDAFSQLEDVMINLDQRYADRLWVLVTRGPLQNVGWDAKTKLPISTKILLEAITGSADFNADYETSLDEVCRYMGSRYRQLTHNDAPGIMLFRGKSGLVEDVTSASGFWIAGAQPSEEPEEDRQPDRSESPHEQDDVDEQDNVGEPNDTAGHQRTSGMRVSLVRLRADDQSDSQDEPAVTEGEKDAAKNGKDSTESTTAADAADPNPVSSAADATPATPEPEEFWDLRDRLESPLVEGLQPIAVTPQLWRKLVQEVLHAEVEGMDPMAIPTRAQVPERCFKDLLALNRSIELYNSDRNLNTVSLEDTTVQRIFELWSEAMLRASPQSVGSHVNVADHLQQLIAVGRMRLWRQHQFQLQAIIGGCDALVGDPRLAETLDEAEAFLAAQRGSVVDVRGLRKFVKDLRRSIQNLDESVENRTAELIEEFGRIQVDDSGRIQMGTAWSVVRRSHAWLRSPLPTARQRRQLQSKIDNVASATPAKEAIDRREQLTFASIERYDALLNRVNVLKNEYFEHAHAESIDGDSLTAGDVSGYSAHLAKVLANDDAGFVNKFAAALRIDPLDTKVEGQLPILHGVLAVPREPNPNVWIRNSADGVVTTFDDETENGHIELQSFNDYLWVEIAPDASHQTVFRVDVRLTETTSAQPPIELQWERSRGVEMTNEPLTIQMTVAARESRRVRLNIRATRYASKSLSDLPIKVSYTSVNVVSDRGVKTDTHVAKMRGSESLRIVLPQQDRIRAVVKSEDGMSKRFTSGESWRDGVWLRTFASRQSRFRISILNEADRACRVRAWLVRLDNPFQNVDEYWPDILEMHTDKLRRQLLDGNNRVDVDILSGDRKLKGPVTLELGADRARTELKWDSASTPENGVPAPAVSLPEASTSEPTDVSHGMALVLRLLDSSDRELPGGDQIIWLVPKPWQPEDYVEIDENSIKYSGGEVQIAARLKREIDGDNIADEIPEIVRKSVVLKWTQDDQWDDFRPGMIGELDSYSLDLSRGGQIEVSVPINRQQTIVRLDVDGWPRAIKRTVDHREGATGRTRDVWNSIKFSSLTMNYGKAPPKLSDCDLPVDATINHVYPDQVVFRGKGKSLLMRISADFSALAYAESPPPRIQLREGNKVLQTYWTDRTIRTVANELADNGRIALTTTVSDLEVSRQEAERRDEELSFQAELTPGGGGTPSKASLSVTLDFTPPTITELRPSSRAPYFLGDPIEWSISFSDPEKNGTRSGVKKILVGPDDNQDGKPDGDRIVDVSRDSIRKIFTPEKEGIYRLAAQAWDAAGLCSEPRAKSIEVIKRPEPPKPKADPQNKQAAMAPPPRGKISGRIETAYRLRGDLVLSPAPSKMLPGGGKIKLDSAYPRFNFSNLPAGEYTLTFRGSKGGTTVRPPYVWKGLKIDVAGGKPEISLSPDDAN